MLIMTEVRTDNLPFKDEPEDAGMSGASVQKSVFTESPDLLLRSSHFDSLEQDTLTDLAAEVREELKTLEDFGIHSTRPRLVIVGDRAVIHNVTDKIEGITLEELMKNGLDSEMLEQYQDLIVSQAKYLAYRYAERKPHMADIFGLHQYMYGTLPSSSNPKIYMQDTDFLTGLSRNYEPSPLLYDEITLVHIFGIAEEIREVEEASETNLAEARQNVEELLSVIPDDNHTLRYYRELIESKLSLPWEEAQEIDI
jgi:hypothetical protein